MVLYKVINKAGEVVAHSLLAIEVLEAKFSYEYRHPGDEGIIKGYHSGEFAEDAAVIQK